MKDVGCIMSLQMVDLDAESISNASGNYAQHTAYCIIIESCYTEDRLTDLSG